MCKFASGTLIVQRLLTTGAIARPCAVNAPRVRVVVWAFNAACVGVPSCIAESEHASCHCRHTVFVFVKPSLSLPPPSVLSLSSLLAFIDVVFVVVVVVVCRRRRRRRYLSSSSSLSLSSSSSSLSSLFVVIVVVVRLPSSSFVFVVVVVVVVCRRRRRCRRRCLFSSFVRSFASVRFTTTQQQSSFVTLPE